MATSVSCKQGLLQRLKDPEYAALYLSAALEDGDYENFLVCLKDVVEAFGFSSLSKKTKLNRQGLYRMLSKRGNPRLSSLAVLLSSVGLKLQIGTQDIKLRA